MNITKSTLAITACTLLLTAGQTALAESAQILEGSASGQAGAPAHFPSDSITVSYADLDLASEESVQVLYRRLQRASRQACGGGAMSHSRSIIMKSSRLRCYRQLLTDAIASIDNENLTRYHAG